MTLKAVAEECEPGVWVAYVPGLPGALEVGDTAADALAGLPDVLIDWHVIGLERGGNIIREPVRIGDEVYTFGVEPQYTFSGRQP